jgi:hypothetical protein
MACVAATGAVPHDTHLGKAAYIAGALAIGGTGYDAASKWSKYFQDKKKTPDLEQGQPEEAEALLRPDEHHEMATRPATTRPAATQPAATHAAEPAFTKPSSETRKPSSCEAGHG